MIITIVWGDVATWFTGLLTAGSLLLGFSILRNDRKKEERDQASKVIAWETSVPNTELEEIREGYKYLYRDVHVWNSSEMPVTNVSVARGVPYDHPLVAMYQATGLMFLELLDGPTEQVWTKCRPDKDYLEPGERVTTRITIPVQVFAQDLILRFRDARAITWERGLASGFLTQRYHRPWSSRARVAIARYFGWYRFKRRQERRKRQSKRTSSTSE